MVYRSIQLLLLFFFFSACTEGKEDKLLIATAANMQFAMEELVEVFSAETGVACEVVIGSSGKLAAQIREGAPFAIFIAADMEYPEQLYQEGRVTVPKVYALGRLVLWTLREDLPPAYERFFQADVRYIALPNPSTAPYGKAALEVLQRKGIAGKLNQKLVYGESIAQTNRYLYSLVADIGFTSKSVVLSSTMKGKGHWKEVPLEDHSPIEQGVTLIKGNKDWFEEAQNFHNFLFSAKADMILERYGYMTTDK